MFERVKETKFVNFYRQLNDFQRKNKNIRQIAGRKFCFQFLTFEKSGDNAVNV